MQEQQSITQTGSRPLSPITFLLFCGATAHLGPRPLIFEVSGSNTIRLNACARAHTHTHTRARTVGLPRLPHQLVAKAATYTTYDKRDTNVHALSGIRTRDPSNRAAADLRHRPHGHRNRLLPYYFHLIIYFLSFFLSLTYSTCSCGC
jgi:hypothetical protein